jgi:hypothetical protein
MKVNQEATSQYNELAEALRQTGMEWVLSEVEEYLSRGKEVPFHELSQDQQALYEERLNEETSRGLKVGRAKPSDAIGVPYLPAERLVLLVEATKRVIDTSDRSQVYVSSFAARHNIYHVIFEQPVGAEPLVPSPTRREMPMAVPDDVEDRLINLSSLLDRNVLD